MANFFEQQAQARSATKKLVVLYLLAVGAIVGAITFVAHLALSVKAPQAQPGTVASADLGIALLVLAVIAIGTVVRMIQIGGNGVNVALQLGGVPLNPQTTDPLEKRLLNVVEEMAIASGVPVPRVFILKDEDGINAFAAGLKPGEAVIGVTRGTIEQLTRDELQGVVAHEFSHIFNGDMRLNLRLLGVLGGILALATVGRIMFQLSPNRSRNDRNSGGLPLVMIGIALFIVGYIGVFFARLIKAAVSRQREYLADASAVQYTRNPDGIGGALMKIRGYENHSSVRSAYAEETSHMFFGSALSFSSLFATHPPLEDRIARVNPMLLREGTWVPKDALDTAGTSSAEVNNAAESALSDLQSASMGFSPSAPAAPAAAAAPSTRDIVASIGEPTANDLQVSQDFLRTLSDSIREQTRDTTKALPLVMSLFLETDIGSPKQNVILESVFSEDFVFQTHRIRKELSSLAETGRLSLLQLCLPALKLLSLSDRQELVRAAHDLTHADGQLDLYEYAAVTLLEHQLLRELKVKRPKPVITSARTNGDLSIVLSSIAYAGADEIAEAKKAFDSGAACLSGKIDQKPIFRELSECALQSIADAIDRLSFLKPADQKVVVEACVQTVVYDRVVTTKESELLRVLCAVLEAPLPAGI